MEQAVIRTWGNSQGIRIPKKIMDQAGLKVADLIEISVRDDAIILKKTFKHKSFEERLAEYDGNISIVDFDWGEPVGREMI